MIRTNLRLLLVLPDYPLVTTTFVDREIARLGRLGIDISIIASRPPGADVPLSSEQLTLKSQVYYLRPISLRTLVASHIYFLLKQPQRLLRSLFYIISRPHPSFKDRAMTLLHASRGVYIAYLWKDRDFDELYVHFAFGNATSAMIAAWLLRKTYTMAVHAGTDVFAHPVILREKVVHARQVVTCTRFNKLHLERLLHHEGPPITFIPHGLDLAAYRPSEDAVVPPIPTILAVGTLTERKGFVHLLRACHALVQQNRRFSCRIVGEGNQRAILEQMIEELSLHGYVSLVGALRHEDVVEEYRRATLFVLPCVQSSTGDLDGIPNVIAEAMAMQVPVVSSDISGVPELIESGVTGLLVRPGDDEALAAAMIRFLDDAPLRAQIGHNGRRAIRRQFDVDVNTRRLAHVLWPHCVAASEEDDRGGAPASSTETSAPA